MAFKDKISQILFLFAIIQVFQCSICDAASNDPFEVRLYSNLANDNKDKNIFYCSVCVKISLAMVRMGASGVTGEEIDIALTSSVQGRDKLANQYHDILEKYQNSGTLKSANKIYVMTGYNAATTFYDLVTKKLFASIVSANFAKNIKSANAINDWVKKQTNITDLISSDQLSSDTRVVIVNAIHFKNQWASKFNPKDTSVAPFVLEDGTKFDVQMMYQNGAFPIAYLEKVGATVLKMPYRNSNYSMVIVLPYEGEKLFDVVRKFNDLKLSDVEESLRSGAIEVQIPKFKFEFKTDLSETLQKMGLKRIFSNGAQLDNMLVARRQAVKDLQVDTIVQKAFIVVDEEGATAAAATEAGITSRFGGERFIADRPFYFLIKDEMNNKIFEGRVNNKFSS